MPSSRQTVLKWFVLRSNRARAVAALLLAGIASLAQDINPLTTSEPSPAVRFRDLFPPAMRDTGFLLMTWQWLGLIGIAVACWLASRLGRILMSLVLRARSRVMGQPTALATAKQLKRASGWLTAAGVALESLPYVALPTWLEGPMVGVLRIFGILSLIMLAWAIWEAASEHLAQKVSGEKRAENLFLPFFGKVVRSLIVIAGVLAIVASFGYNVGALLAGLGLGGLVIALAAKDSVENVFGSLTIIFDMPFAIGDWIKIGTVEGMVQEINLRSTRIRTGGDSLITLPNSTLIKASVENMGARRFLGIKITAKVALDTPKERILSFCEVVRKSLESNEAIRPDGQFVRATGLSDTGIEVTVQFNLAGTGYSDELRERENVTLIILEAAEETQIHLAGSLPVTSMPGRPVEAPGSALPQVS